MDISGNIVTPCRSIGVNEQEYFETTKILTMEKTVKGKKGKRRKNRLPDKGEPNTVKWNQSGTTAKKYGKLGRKRV